MALELLRDIAISLVWTAVGLIVGIISAVVGAYVVPKIMNRLTPNIDEEKEMKKGNVAVGEYYGRVTSAALIGMMIVIAAAIIALNLPSSTVLASVASP